MKNPVLFVIAFISLLSCTENKSEVYSTQEGAIGGYDPVEYFISQSPIKGKKEFSYEWHDATWYFNSMENRAAFQNNPERFAPQYGGYCAFGMSRGYKAETQPDAWTIVNDKLYLNYNTEVKEKWFPEKEERIPIADSTWLDIRYK